MVRDINFFIAPNIMQIYPTLTYYNITCSIIYLTQLQLIFIYKPFYSFCKSVLFLQDGSSPVPFVLRVNDISSWFIFQIGLYKSFKLLSVNLFLFFSFPGKVT